MGHEAAGFFHSLALPNLNDKWIRQDNPVACNTISFNGRRRRRHPCCCLLAVIMLSSLYANFSFYFCMNFNFYINRRHRIDLRPFSTSPFLHSWILLPNVCALSPFRFYLIFFFTFTWLFLLSLVTFITFHFTVLEYVDTLIMSLVPLTLFMYVCMYTCCLQFEQSAIFIFPWIQTVILKHAVKEMCVCMCEHAPCMMTRIANVRFL